MPLHEGDIYNHLQEVKRRMKTLPVLAGQTAENFFKRNFDLGGFQGDAGLIKWDQRKDKSDPGRAILVGKAGGYLRRGLRKEVTSNVIAVRVGGRAATYADIHNFGGTITIKVTPQFRKFCWAMYFKYAGLQAKGETKRMGVRSNWTPGISSGIMRWKYMAITSKSVISIKMPKRQFIGQSRMLDKELEQLFIKTLTI